MLEYTIVIQHNNSRPFVLHTYKNFDDCYCALLQMINTDKVKKEYYVVNDFYKNEYPPFLSSITKYTIKVRNVSEWEIYTKNKKQVTATEPSNIINLVNYM